MGKIDLYEIVVYIGTIIISIAFVMAFRLRKDKRLPVYYKFLYWMVLPRLVMSLTLFGLELKLIDITFITYLQIVCTISDFILITFFFFLINKKKIFTILVFIISVFSIILYHYYNNLYSSIFELNAIIGLSVFMYCLQYFYSLFEHVEKVSILRNPTFLIVLGLFFFATINFPLLSSTHYLHAAFGAPTSRFIVSLINFLIFARFLFVIRACSRTIVNNYIEDSATPVKKLTNEFPFLEDSEI